MKKAIKNKKFLHVKKGDYVKVISGQNKGKTGTISEVDKKTSKVIITGLNIRTKHIKPKQQNESKQQGKIEKVEFPIHSSNLLKYED